jgi:hypothetical protein
MHLAMRVAIVGALAPLLGCPAPARYKVERPGLTCERATRVAHRTVLEMGYSVTSVVPARVYRPGEVAVRRTRPDGGVEHARVVITCDSRGAILQPYEETLLPNFEFSRAFGYSFKTLVQRPDVEEPRAERGLEVLVQALTPDQAILDLDGVPTVGGAVPVRVTVRNNTDRAVRLDPARIALVPAGGDATLPLSGAALAAALASGTAGDRVRAEPLRPVPIAPRTTVRGYLVYPRGVYREARVGIEDVETEETEGFVAPVQ